MLIVKQSIMNHHDNHQYSHQNLQSQINNLEKKYNSIKSFLWSQFIWRQGTQNVNIPQKQQQHVNHYTYAMTNNFNRNHYTCNQCMYPSKAFVQNDKESEKYCKVLDINSEYQTKTLQCYPIQVDSNYHLKSVCKNCGSRKFNISARHNPKTQFQNEYQKLLQQQGYNYPATKSKPCKTIPAYNEDANNVKNCVFVDNVFLQNECHSCRQNYCEYVQENNSSYTYSCNPVRFDAQGNIESICTNPALRKKQYVMKKTPNEQMFYRENNERNDKISKYTMEAFETMKQNTMKSIEANENLKDLYNSFHSLDDHRYNKYSKF